MSKNPAYGFESREVAEKLKAFSARLGGAKSGNTGAGWSTSSFSVMFGEVSTEVTQASGDDLGTGEVKVETWDATAATVTRAQPGAATAVTVFNTEEVAIPVGTPVNVYKVSSSYIVFPATPTTTGYGTLASALATTDTNASVTLDGNSPMKYTGNVSAKNWTGMEGASGAKCIITKSGDQFILIQVACA